MSLSDMFLVQIDLLVIIYVIIKTGDAIIDAIKGKK